MAAARWKALCIDTTDGESLGRFWAMATGLDFRRDGHGGKLVGPTEGHGIAMCKVVEPKSVKHRVHLDVYCRSVEDLVRIGATVVAHEDPSVGRWWTVMQDPEGGEFCAFVKPELPEYRLFQVVVDAYDAEQMARWWAAVFGVAATQTRTDTSDWWRVFGAPGVPFERLTFQRVPEPKTARNRLHWDLYGSVEEIVAAGASVLARPGGPTAATVMADPEGNEFRVFEGSS